MYVAVLIRLWSLNLEPAPPGSRHNGQLDSHGRIVPPFAKVCLMRAESFVALPVAACAPLLLGALACVGCASQETNSPGSGADAMTSLEGGARGNPDGGAGNLDGPAGVGMDATMSTGDGSQSPPTQDGASIGAEAAPPGTDASPESGTGGGCSSLPLCDDFEEDTPGTKPTNWSLVLGCNASQMSDDASTGLIIGVTSSQHHSGNNSVEVMGGDSCGYYFENTAAVATLAAGKQLYARFWVMFSGLPTMGHNGFLSMGLMSTMTTAPQLRLGFQSDIIDWNYIPPDSTLPDLSPTGVAASAATMASMWTCMEFHVDETTGQLEFWLNGTSVSGLSYDGGSTGVDMGWLTGGPPAPVVPISFGLGWLHLNDNYTVWYDDVALGAARIGCN